jgi:2-aminoethylphosphonate-pyruvate transaminase
VTTRSVLLNPGPVTLSERVRSALARGDWCHRETEFAELTQRVNDRIVEVYDADPDEYAAVLLTCSGTGAVEAMLTTLAPTESPTLVAANGVYGERMAAMLREQQRPTVVVAGDWMEPIDFAEVERQLTANPSITHVAAVHHETTTGRLNDIARLASLCAERKISLLLDSVSAFGAEEIRFGEWQIEALAATANKCLHGVPGMSFVVAAHRSLAARRERVGSVYLDLGRYYSAQHGDGFSPFTLAVQPAFALDAALDEFSEQGGWRQRQARYRAIGDDIRRHLSGLDVETVLPAEQYSATMHSYWLPEHVDYDRFHDELKTEGFVIYAGQGNLAGRIFRIAHMGAITDHDVEALKRALSRGLGAPRP